MILTCPSCSARYLISADAIGGAGRTVRCGKCGHSWDQPSAHDSLDELARTNLDDLPDAGMTSSEPAAEEPTHDPIPEGVKPIISPAPANFPGTPVKSSGLIRRFLPKITAAVAAIAFFALLVMALVGLRAPVMNLIPATKPVFVALGVEEDGNADTLAFDSVNAKIDGDKLTLTGSLINLSSHAMILPPLRAEVLDAHEKVIASFPVEMDRNMIEGEQDIGLNFSFEKIPAGAAQARLKFSEPEAAAPDEDHGESAENAADHSANEAHDAAPHAESDHATTGAEDVGNTHAPTAAAPDHPPAHE